MSNLKLKIFDKQKGRKKKYIKKEIEYLSAHC